MRTKTAITLYLEAKSEKSTTYLAACRKYLELLAESVPQLPGTPEQLQDILKKAPTPWVKNYMYRIWSSFYRWCRRKYKIENVLELVDKPGVPEVELRYLTPLELNTLLSNTTDKIERAIISLGADIGVRASEFGRIRVQDIALETILLHGKRNRHLRVPILPETYQILMDVIKDIPERGPDSTLFLNARGEPMSRDTIYRIVRQCMVRAGITGPKLGSHTLRHTLGTNYIDNGGDAFTLQRIMRHRSINTTKKYVHVSLRKAIDAHRQFSPLRNALRGVQGLLFDDQNTM